MPAFLATVLGLCRFRGGPEDMPYAPRLLVALLVACGVLETLSDGHQGASPRMVAAALLGGLAVFAAVFLLLRARAKAERFVQTGTSLAAVYLLFSIVADALALRLPIKELREQILTHPGHAPTLTGGETLILLAIVGLGLWQLCVWVRILRRALDVSMGGAGLAFLALWLVNWIVAGLMAAAIGLA